MPQEAGWLEVHKLGGEWKVENQNGTVVATEDRKSKAVDKARHKVNRRRISANYAYIGAVIYNTDGSRSEIIVGDAAKSWVKSRAAPERA